jgi:hypothetical protein
VTLRTAKEKLKQEFSKKLNHADLMALINLLERVDENARLETEQKNIRERNRQSTHG